MYPGIELRLLRYAVAVAETLSFSQAADRLNTSQPSLSRQMLQLESDLGIKLFHRTKRWVEITPAGRRFVAEARKAIVHAERAAELARGVAVDERESYTIGYCAFIDLRFLAAIKRIKPIGPAHFVYHSATYAEIVTKLEAHEWEAALMPLPVREKELVAESLFREPLAAALPASHSLAKKREIELSDLRDESIILAPKCFGPGFRHQLIAPLEAAGVQWPINHEATSPLEALHLVADGAGVTLAQQSVLDRAPERVVVRPIKGVQTEIETCIVFHCENDSQILAAFLEAVRHTRDHYLHEHRRDLRISA